MAQNTMVPVPMPGLNQTAVIAQVDQVTGGDAPTDIGLGKVVKCTPSGLLMTAAFMPRLQTSFGNFNSATSYLAGKCVGGRLTLDINEAGSNSGAYTIEQITIQDEGNKKPEFDILFIDGTGEALSDNAYPNFTTLTNFSSGSVVSVRTANYVTFLASLGTNRVSYASVTPYVSGVFTPGSSTYMYLILASAADYSALANKLIVSVVMRITTYKKEANTP